MEEVRERIDMWVERLDEQRRQHVTGLQERIELRESELAKEAEAKRARRREEMERKRQQKEEELRVKRQYGQDVRIEGEHEEDDMMTQLGFTTFGSSKK